MGMMSFDLFKQIIDQVEDRCEAVTLASRGEPLACPDIGAMLRYAGGKFLALKLNTNAWYLDEKLCHAILKAEFNTVVFSADAASEPAYSQLRVNGQLEKVLNNIKLFGYHGIYDKEIDDGQEFMISVSVKTDKKKLFHDRISDTLDYSILVTKIKTIFNSKRYNLIESLAKDISDEILLDDRVKSIIVSIKKPFPPLDIEIESAEVILKEKR